VKLHSRILKRSPAHSSSSRPTPCSCAEGGASVTAPSPGSTRWPSRHGMVDLLTTNVAGAEGGEEEEEWQRTRP